MNKRAVVRCNLSNTVFALVLAVMSAFGSVSNLDSVFWLVAFMALTFLLGLFLLIALRTKIYCGEKSFVFIGIHGKREEIAYESIRCIIMRPLSVRIVIDGEEDVVLFSPAVSGVTMFINVARISDIRYGN